MRRNRATILVLASCFAAALALPAQQSPPQDNAESVQLTQESLDELSPENRAVLDALSDDAAMGYSADVEKEGRTLLPALKPNTSLANSVILTIAFGAIGSGDDDYALSLLKPFADAHPRNWAAAVGLARAYAESGDKTLRDQQIAHVIDLHKQTSDPEFANMHNFLIQRVQVKSGYADFLYPFEPLKPYNTYLAALIYKSDGELDYRLELGSEDEDQAFFKPKKPGERRFSIDSYHEKDVNGQKSESQGLMGFIDGVFDYDRMRDLMVKVANGEPLPQN